MVQIDYMEKPFRCCECPFFLVFDDRGPVRDAHNNDIRGAYTRLRRCMFAADYAREYVEKHPEQDDEYDGDYDSLEYEIMDKATHADTDKNIHKIIELWCPITEVKT